MFNQFNFQSSNIQSNISQQFDYTGTQFSQGNTSAMYPTYFKEDFNDNISYDSRMSQSTAYTQRKSYSEELYRVVSSCIVNILPDLSSKCCEIVFESLTNQIQSQKKEIEELNTKLEQLKKSMKECSSFNSGTPFKKLEGLTKDIEELKSSIDNKVCNNKKLFNDFIKNFNENQKNSLSFISNQLSFVKEKINEGITLQEQGKVVEDNHYVEFLGLKNLIQKSSFEENFKEKNEKFLDRIKDAKNILKDNVNKRLTNKKNKKFLYCELQPQRNVSFFNSNDLEEAFVIPKGENNENVDPNKLKSKKNDLLIESSYSKFCF